MNLSRAGPGLAFALAALIAACSDEDEPTVCTYIAVSAPAGTIRWTDRVVRLPDRVYVYHAGHAEPLECSFEPPRTAEGTMVYSCAKTRPGLATLSVLIDRQRWDTPFYLDYENCHAVPLTLDLELDPAAGETEAP